MTGERHQLRQTVGEERFRERVHGGDAGLATWPILLQRDGDQIAQRSGVPARDQSGQDGLRVATDTQQPARPQDLAKELELRACGFGW